MSPTPPPLPSSTSTTTTSSKPAEACLAVSSGIDTTTTPLYPLIDEPVFNKPHLLLPHPRSRPPSLPTKAPPPVDKPTNEGPTTRYTLVFARGPSSHLAPCSATRRDWVGPRCLGLIRPGGTLSFRCCPLPTPRGFRRPRVTLGHIAPVASPWCHGRPATASHLSQRSRCSAPTANLPEPVRRIHHPARGATPDSRPPRDIGSRSCGLAPETRNPDKHRVPLRPMCGPRHPSPWPC